MNFELKWDFSVKELLPGLVRVLDLSTSTALMSMKNQIQFTSVPTLEVELKGSPGFELKVDEFEANLKDGGSTLMIKKMLVETDGFDQIIRPKLLC
ncbi:hypothetical protein Bca101_042129 [Brassica carinata]